MVAGENDKVSQVILSNEFGQDKNNNIDMRTFNFMPSLQLDSVNSNYSNLATFGILDYNFSINTTELFNFIEINLVCHNRSSSGSSLILTPFRLCTPNDFKSKSFSNLSTGNNRLCPSIPDNFDQYRLKNAYANQTERLSFSVEIWRCNRVLNPKCKTETEVKSFLDVAFFTMSISHDLLHFGSDDKD